jgi:adenosylcobinamide-GDP ribazoletransferase
MDTETRTDMIPRGLVTAFRTLTILPMPGNEIDKPANALPWFPVVGAVLGILICGLVAIVEHVTNGSGGLAIIAITLSVFLTRGLHLDGLADCADAFWGGWDRDRVLAIMKDSALGTFGTIALVLVLLAKWCSIAALVDNGSLHWIIVAMVISRAVQVDLAVTHDYARPEGGTGATFIKDAKREHWIPAAWSTVALVVIFGGFAWRPVIAIFLALALGRGFGRLCRQKAGGMTGDLLGAASEITETAILLLAAALG